MISAVPISEYDRVSKGKCQITMSSGLFKGTAKYCIVLVNQPTARDTHAPHTRHD